MHHTYVIWVLCLHLTVSVLQFLMAVGIINLIDGGEPTVHDDGDSSEKNHDPSKKNNRFSKIRAKKILPYLVLSEYD